MIDLSTPMQRIQISQRDDQVGTEQANFLSLHRALGWHRGEWDEPGRDFHQEPPMGESSAHPLLPERAGEAAQRRPRILARSIGAAAACALAFAGLVTLGLEEGGKGGSRSPSTLLTAARQQQLAYDGPYDTPPVTWYFPGSSNQNTLGYTWNNAQMQTPTVTYGPGVPTNNGMAYTTADTIGYDFGDTTTSHPMGGNAVYQHVTTYANQPGQPPDDTMYQYTGYQTSAARGGRGWGLKQRGARAQSLVELGSLDRELADEDPSGVVGRLASKLR